MIDDLHGWSRHEEAQGVRDLDVYSCWIDSTQARNQRRDHEACDYTVISGGITTRRPLDLRSIWTYWYHPSYLLVSLRPNLFVRVGSSLRRGARNAVRPTCRDPTLNRLHRGTAIHITQPTATACIREQTLGSRPSHEAPAHKEERTN